MTEPTSRGIDADIPAPDAPTVAPPDDASVWEDFIDIFYEPSAVFARRSGFIIPMLVVVLLVGGLYLLNSAVWAPIVDAEMARAFAKQPNLTAEQMETARKFGGVMNKIGVVIFTPIAIFFTGLALWVVGKFFDAKETLGKAVMVASYAFIPRIVEGVVTSIQGLLLDPSQFTGRWRISLGVGRFLDPDTTSPAARTPRSGRRVHDLGDRAARDRPLGDGKDSARARRHRRRDRLVPRRGALAAPGPSGALTRSRLAVRDFVRSVSMLD